MPGSIPHDRSWRIAQLDSVAAGCLAALGRVAQAAPLIKSSTPIVLARWKPATFYGHDALERAIRVEQLAGDGAALAGYQQLMAATTEQKSDGADRGAQR